MCNDIASQATNDADGCYVESEEVLLCHFFPYSVSFGSIQRKIGGNTLARPAASKAFGSVTPEIARVSTDARNARE